MKKEDHVVEQLVQMINRGDYRVGDRLPPERSLAAQVRASRHTLRAAVRQLAARGVIEVRAGSGSYVSAQPVALRGSLPSGSPRKGERAAERLEASYHLLPAISAVAAAKATDRDAKALENVLMLASKSIVAGKSADFPTAMRVFTTQLAMCTRNRLFAETARQLDAANELCAEDATAPTSAEHETLFAGLVEIVNAIKAADPDLAADRTRKHILRICALLVRHRPLTLPKTLHAAMADLPE